MEKTYQEYFYDLIGKLSGTPIRGDGKIGDSLGALQENCTKLQNALTLPLTVDTSTGHEPCPFCTSALGNKKADMAWIGINPGKPPKEWKKFSNDGKWSDVADFCAPKGDDLSKTENVYKYMAEEGGESGIKNSYYRTVLLVYLTLMGKIKGCEKWTDLPAEYRTDKILKVLEEHPIINAELLPYKSDSINFKANKILNSEVGERYKDYFTALMQFIEEKTNDDAYIVFCGAAKEVKLLLETCKIVEKIEGEEPESKFPMIPWKEKRLMILTPFRKFGNYYAISALKTEAEKERKKLGNRS